MAGLIGPLELALQLAGVFERLQVRYLLGGSFASTTFGEPRTTLDIDFVADLQLAQVGAFLGLLGTDFFVDAEWVAREVRSRGSFQVVHRATMLRVDVFVPPWTGLDLWKWEHRRRVHLPVGGGGDLDVTSAEGIVLQKLRWFESGGRVSERQWRDVLGVLKAQRGALDLAAMRDWARKLGLDGLLAKALLEAGIETD